jgi:hypothetical protein
MNNFRENLSELNQNLKDGTMEENQTLQQNKTMQKETSDKQELEKVIKWFEGLGFEAAHMAAWQIRLGKNMADKKLIADNLEDATKPLLSSIKLEHKGASDAAQTTRALADSRYETHIKGRNIALHDALIAKIKYESFCNYMDKKQTEEVTKRQEYQAQRRTV